MHQRILVGLDDSRASIGALEEAVRLAKAQHALLRLVHVIDLHDLYWCCEDVEPACKAELECCRRGRELLERARRLAAAAGVQADTAVLAIEGERVGDALVDVGRRWGADLIVTGTHGRRGVRRLLLGSVAERVGRLSPVSVLVVGQHRGA